MVSIHIHRGAPLVGRGLCRVWDHGARRGQNEVLTLCPFLTSPLPGHGTLGLWSDLSEPQFPTLRWVRILDSPLRAVVHVGENPMKGHENRRRKQKLTSCPTAGCRVAVIISSSVRLCVTPPASLCYRKPWEQVPKKPKRKKSKWGYSQGGGVGLGSYWLCCSLLPGLPRSLIL